MVHMTTAFTPMQNEIVERANQTIGDAVRTMLTGGHHTRFRRQTMATSSSHSIKTTNHGSPTISYIMVTFVLPSRWCLWQYRKSLNKAQK